MGAITDLAIANITDQLNKQNTAAKVREVFELVDTLADNTVLLEVTMTGNYAELPLPENFKNSLFNAHIYTIDGNFYNTVNVHFSAQLEDIGAEPASIYLNDDGLTIADGTVLYIVLTKVALTAI